MLVHFVILLVEGMVMQDYTGRRAANGWWRRAGLGGKEKPKKTEWVEEFCVDTPQYVK